MVYIISSPEDLDRSLGVKKKMISITKVFGGEFGYPIRMVFRERNRVILRTFSNLWKFSDEERSLRSKIFYYKLVEKMMKGKMENSGKKNIVYFRFTYADRYLLHIVRTLRENNVLIFELPTPHICKEYSTMGTRGFILKNLMMIYGRRILNSANLIVSIGSVEGDCLEAFKDRELSITNGIDVDEIPVSKAKVEFSGRINLISVASVSRWHGLDRVIWGIYDYMRSGGGNEVFFNIVGDGRELPNLKKLVKRLGMEKYVRFHGPLSGEMLDKLFDEVHIGIGDIGSHRKRLKVSLALKHREYAARGLPFVLSTPDPDFPKTLCFVKYTSPNDKPLNMREVIDWYRDLVKEQDGNLRILTRKYAEENLSWNAKLSPLIERIKKTLR